MPGSVRKYRFSIFFNLILLMICIALFIYARHSDANLRKAQESIAATQDSLGIAQEEIRLNQGDIYQTQLRSCARDNVLRTERNAETQIIKDILTQIAETTRARARLSRRNGNIEEAELGEASAKRYDSYNERLKLVPLTDCNTIIPRRD